MALRNQRIVQSGESSAAARMARIPVVRSAWSKLFDLYMGTKGSHPHLRLICEALEDQAVILRNSASSTVYPVILKFQPQISVVNNVACKSLDWLEMTFPLLQAPTKEVVAMAVNKMHKAQESVQQTVEQAVDRVVHTDFRSGPVLESAMSAAEARLDRALSISESLVDHMLPPTEEEKSEDPNSVRGFESGAQSYPVRLLSVSTKLCRRTCEAVKRFSGFPCSTRRFQAHLSVICGFPMFIQHQAMIVILFVIQMYTLNGLLPPERAGTPTRKDPVQWQESPTWRLPNDVAGDCQSCEAWRAGPHYTRRCTMP